ncbi:MAG: EamA family transporter [Treponemataceae bacterium]|nr:EamA family transporter [Treponemataceae bacterium]
MPLVLVYGLLKGGREIAKKLAMQKDSVMDVLIIYTVFSYILVIPQAPMAGGMEPKFYGFIAIKSFCIFLAWICSFQSLKKLPVSIFGILDLSRVLFASFFGIVFLHEGLSLYQAAGLITVCGGLLLLRFKPKFLRKIFHIQAEVYESKALVTENGKKEPVTIYVILSLISCLLNAVSGFLDKVLMKDITTCQMQFWYMFFIVCFYLLYVIFTRKQISISAWKNGWVYLMAVIFVIGDKSLFIANANPESKITMMTLIKQSACLVTILGGKWVFKEKNIAYKLFCAAIIIAGIVFGVIS